MSGREAVVLAVVLSVLAGVVVGQTQSAGEPNVPKLFVVGDSTAGNGPDLGWGSHLGRYFDPSKLHVVNRARGGRSSRTFLTEGLWDQVLGEMRAGDFVLIQFGHNDGGPINDDRRARGSLPGLGDETQEIHNRVTNADEVVHTYGWYIRRFIADTRGKGATPVVLSLTVRNIWDEGKVERGSGRFNQWSAEIARSEGVAFVDLTNIIADQYELLGAIRVASFFPRDHTHTSVEAANLNAALVVSGLRALEGCPLAGMLSPEGQAVTPYAQNVVVRQAEDILTRPWMPEALPMPDPNLPTLFLIGDSTVRTGSLGNGANGQWGWGAPIADFFDRTKINVQNRAWGGTSSRTFQTQGFWEKVLADMKPGDCVILQFGHNDSSPLNDTQRARGTIPGAGDETEEIDNLLTGQHEVVHTYGWYIRKFIADARSKGATAIVCSPVPRNNWAEEGRVGRASQSYGRWAAEAAQAEGAAFVDLNELIARCYEQMGCERVTGICFPPGERTHTSAAGAQINAACVVEGLEVLDDCPLVKYLLNTRL
ncbi:MAG: rhamnogalacturonan acetylesterase [Phycisphaerales bacterium]